MSRVRHVRSTPTTLACDRRWLDHAFSAKELAAIYAPSSTVERRSEEGVLIVRADGTLTWRGDAERLDAWQQDVLDESARANPFEEWTLADTLDCFRGVIDRTHRLPRVSRSMPPPERRAVRRASRGQARAELDAVLAADDLDAWLAEPVGRLRRVSRYLHELWLGRPDLHGLFPRVGESDQSTAAYLAWVRDHGAAEMAIPQELVPDRETASVRIGVGGRRRHAVRIAGFVDDVLGLGEAARRVEVALAWAGVETARFTSAEGTTCDVNVVCLNPDVLTEVATDVGVEFFHDRHTIGVWFWESTSPPPNLDKALAYVDEIWVASDYVRSVLEPHIHDGTPIHVMPLAVRAPEPGEHPRSHFGLPDDAFVYGFFFDFNSTIERKHAVGLVEAYTRAYPEERADTRLLIKTIHAELNIEDHERLLLAVQDRTDIIVMDAHLPISERDSLIAHLDCYVSLHRSEGFGLTIAEALLCGVPTIATGYSANVEFAPAEACYLVDYELTTVPDSMAGSPYPPGGQWADPDLNHAAQLMLHVREHPAEARAMAARGRELIARECSLERAGTFMRARLEQIWKENPLPNPEQLAREAAEADPIGAVERYVNAGPRGGWLVGARGIKRPLRKLLLRITRPYADRQKELEVDIARSLRHLQRQVDELRASQNP